MEEIDLKKLAGALGLTEQQTAILISLYRVESSGRRAKPNAIIANYCDLFGMPIQTSNFFAQTRRLQERGFIGKTGLGVYRVELDRIKKTLAMRKEEKTKELDEFDKLIKQTASYFRKISYQTDIPTIEYLDYEQLFRSMTKDIKKASNVYALTNFPTTAYTYRVAGEIGRVEFLKSLWERCFEKERLRIFYLTNLDIDFLFNHAFRACRNPKEAYFECKIMIDQLLNQLESHANLEIRHLKELHAMDIFMPEKDEPLQFYLFTRDEHRDISGGIRVQSPETADAAKKSFMREFEYAKEISTEDIGIMQKRLKKAYGKI